MSDKTIGSGAMRYFIKFRSAYLVERKSHLETMLMTLYGLWGRLVRGKKYLSGVIMAEQVMINRYADIVKKDFDAKIISKTDIKKYKASLKGANVKYKQRSDFLVIMVSIISLLGLTTFSDKAPFYMDKPIPFFATLLFLLMVITVAIERINMNSVVAENEELINIFDSAF
ncbi:hypothetical protein N0U25_09490 [Pseudomonas sivasensis]|uniref:hypothetical protein n=1 Tax=Pseudomonas sivasensis TaxID=1880678 RepID=UPI0021A99C5B|nr:hypothetical protein [Pseudomonas sivasensis]MCT4498024.1 hypothetical protein [Pseudomonas sivasensis]